MDTQLDYPTLIKQVLREYAKYYSAGMEYPLRLIFDDERKSYGVLDIGWYDKKYVHAMPIHIELIGEKIWIQQDESEDGITSDLLAAGVPADKMVLGFRRPELRQYTEFAIG